jgi:predicted transcriptional regulator
MATTANDTVVISLRLPADITIQIDELAAWMERSRSWVATRAIQEYLEREYALMAEIKAGDKDVEEGRTVTIEQAEPWLQELAAGKYSEPPQSDKQ